MNNDKLILNQRIKIDLTDIQKDLLTKCFGMSRFYFNKCLEWLNENYPDIMKKGYNKQKTEVSKQITMLATTFFRKKYHDLVLSAPALILNPSINRFKTALSRVFFKDGKRIKFKRKHHDKQSVTFERKDSTSFKYKRESDILTIIRLRDVKLKYKIRYTNFTIKQVTISKSGKSYYATICMEVDKSEITPLKKTWKTIGLDWGEKVYFTGWDGNKPITFNFNQDVLDKYNRRIKLKQLQLSKKIVYSKIYFRCKDELNRAYFNKSNYIMENIKKFCFLIASEYDKVILEDLSMSNMIKSQYRKERAIRADRPFCLFKDYLKYKLNLHNKKLFVVDKFFASTQICSNCGNVLTKEEKLQRSDRVYDCKLCGYKEDRDLNAAKNIFMNTNIKEI